MALVLKMGVNATSTGVDRIVVIISEYLVRDR